MAVKQNSEKESKSKQPLTEKDQQQSAPIDTRISDADNWGDLASNLREKVLKRTSEASFLHTRAGFLIAAAVIDLQILASLPKLEKEFLVWGMVVAGVLGIASLIMAIISMHIGKSPTPLNPDDMILTLTERPTMSRRDFSNWLAKSYAAANTKFNSIYSHKYNQQLVSAALLVVSFIIIVILQGVSTYHV